MRRRTKSRCPWRELERLTYDGQDLAVAGHYLLGVTAKKDLEAQNAGIDHAERNRRRRHFGRPWYDDGMSRVKSEVPSGSAGSIYCCGNKGIVLRRLTRPRATQWHLEGTCDPRVDLMLAPFNKPSETPLQARFLRILQKTFLNTSLSLGLGYI